MKATPWLSIVAAITGFASFHYLFSDGWSFDGTWSKLREIRERLLPSIENRRDGWWAGTLAYVCAIVSAICWIVAAALASG